MLITLITHDKPNHLHVRMENRDSHLEYIEQTGVVEMAGPFLDMDGKMCGSLIVLDVEDMASAKTWAENDPYNKAGLFENITLKVWKKIIG